MMDSTVFTSSDIKTEDIDLGTSSIIIEEMQCKPGDKTLSVVVDFPQDSTNLLVPECLGCEFSSDEVNRQCSSAASIVTSTLSSNVVHNYLQRNCIGRALLRLPKNKFLHPSVRQKLCHEILVAELGNDGSKVISGSRLFQLSQDIVNLFPEEATETYYIGRRASPLARGIQPRGMLYDKYNNILKFLRMCGLRSNRKGDKKTSAPSTAVEEAVQWLANRNDLHPHLLDKWRFTAQHRLDSLSCHEARRRKNRMGMNVVERYIARFPCLQKLWGIKLLLQDFDFLHPGKSRALLDNWHPIAAKLVRFAGAKEDFYPGNFVSCLWLIPGLFRQSLISASSATGRCVWKPTAAESRNGFLLHVSHQSELASIITALEEKCRSVNRALQPFPLVVGPLKSENLESFVVVGSLFYPMDSPLHAVDSCFKLVHALKTQYPCQSWNAWLFLQQAIYKLYAVADPMVPAVITKVKEFEKLQLDLSPVE